MIRAVIECCLAGNLFDAGAAAAVQGVQVGDFCEPCVVEPDSREMSEEEAGRYRLDADQLAEVFARARRRVSRDECPGGWRFDSFSDVCLALRLNGKPGLAQSRRLLRQRRRGRHGDGRAGEGARGRWRGGHQGGAGGQHPRGAQRRDARRASRFPLSAGPRRGGGGATGGSRSWRRRWSAGASPRCPAGSSAPCWT